MAKLTVKDLDFKGKKILIRCDFNVPQDANLNITDDTRIRASLATIKYILNKQPEKLILMSHLGRPDGKRVEKYSLKPVAVRLSQLLDEDVFMTDDCIGDNVQQQINNSKEKILLLENLRFHPEEEANDATFAKALASFADVFVNDAFGTAHRAHASTEGVAHYLRSCAGLLLQKEIEFLEKAIKNPAKPYCLILGGAKVSDKIGVIDNLLPKVDKILIGGGMCYTFLKSMGKEIGNSKLEKEKLDLAKSILEKAKVGNVKIILPVDHIAADKVSGDAISTTINDINIPDGLMGLDIGPRTVELFKIELKDAKTIVWNGPLGVFEIDKFSSGSIEIAKFITTLKATSIIGGGDTAAAIAKFGLEAKMSHISTGGGASLEFLEGKSLPGIAALTEK